MKWGRNDPCFCQSGVKYKRCHAIREQQLPLPKHEFDEKLRRAWFDKQCLHPDASTHTCAKITAAHTIQKSNVLGSLVDTHNHVWTFAPDMRRTSGSGRRSVGWKEASTFYGFCNVHDRMFAPIESQVFAHTREQCFLTGYRALCHEIHLKQAAIRAYDFLSSAVDRGHKIADQIEIQKEFLLSKSGSIKGLELFVSMKRAMDVDFKTNDFSQWESLTVYFKGDLCVASTGVVSPNRTVCGREIQTLHDPLSEQESILFGTIRTQDGGAVVFVWRNHDSICKQFVSSLLTIPIKQLPQVLVQFMFAYVSNTFFSQAWWDTRTNAVRMHITELAEISNAYYSNFQYRPLPIVPWIVQRVFLCDREVAV